MDLHRVTVNTIKGLAMDAVQAANSGHPGMPMGAADMAVVLWREFLSHDPADPTWFNRDRFILSAGHGSMLLYSLLHLSGYDLSVDDLKQFRQWGSKTPGHPEYGHTEGVEITTGPLGQGFASGIGMALAERWLRENYGAELCDHYTYAIVSDGDLMEGLSGEAASLAGHLGLGRVVYLYDDNLISIDGSTDLAFSEDRCARFAAYGWHVQAVDGHDPAALRAAIAAARSETDRPSLIACRTVIGQGSAKEGTSKTHGAPLGAEDIAATKLRLGMDPAAMFAVPDDARRAMRGHGGAAARAAWEARLADHPQREGFLEALEGNGAALVDKVAWPKFEVGKGLATRKATAACVKALVAAAPWVLGGSADLAESNGVEIGRAPLTAASFANAGHIHFGVREHAMGSIANGMALHGGVLPYVATFLMFHDYMRPSVRLACLMGLRVVFLYSHDSIFLGEDGPTHQPVETLVALRTVPNLHVFRPGDANETAEAWKAALTRKDGPTAIVLTRQNVPTLDRTRYGAVAGTQRGAYVLSDSPDAQVILVATGSEVPLALDAQAALAGEGIASRVVSAPCMERFTAQAAGYREEVLPAHVPRVSIEAGLTFGWKELLGGRTLCVGIDHFGASAPAEVLAEKFGFTVANVVATAKRALASA